MTDESRMNAEPAFADLAGCKTWLAALPADAARSYAMLASEVPAIVASSLHPPIKLELYEALRPRVFRAQTTRAAQFRNKPVPLQEDQRRALTDVVGLWRALGDGYRALIADMAGTAPELALHAALISQRAMRCGGLAMDECNRAYHATPPGLWQALNETYSFAESAGALDTAVEDALGRARPATTAGATYVQVALAQLAQPDSLTVDQMEAVGCWAENWQSLVRLAPDRGAAAGAPLSVDLAADRGPGFVKDAAGPGVRYLDVDALARTLRQTTAAVRQQTPSQLGLGDMPREACERLLMLLHIQWCAAGTGRLDERKPASIKVLVSPNLASIHFHLTGKVFQSPALEFSSADRQRMDFMGEAVSRSAAVASVRSAAIDTWDIVNQSVSGFLGMSRMANEAMPVSHGQLIGLQPASKTMYLGIIQRLTIDAGGGIWVGLRLLHGVPQGAAVRVAATPSAPAGKYDRALLMPEDAGRKSPASLILMPGWFQASRLLDLHTGAERRVRLLALLDQGPGYERASFANV